MQQSIFKYFPAKLLMTTGTPCLIDSDHTTHVCDHSDHAFLGMVLLASAIVKPVAMNAHTFTLHPPCLLHALPLWANHRLVNLIGMKSITLIICYCS